MRRLLLLLTIAALALSAACGSSDNGTSSAGSKESSDHNAADVVFVQGMVPHHEQAVEMADIALGKAKNPQVKDLASRIKAAQGPEIELMRGWLADWNEPIASKSKMGDGTMSHGSSGGKMSEGMMTESGMRDLKASSGDDFDKLFLQGMLEHHKGAVAMAKIELGEGKFPKAKELAQKIVQSQQLEITEMEELLGNSTSTTTP